MVTVVKKEFKDQDIVIDGETTYVECIFIKCHFYFSGTDFTFLNCKLKEPTVTFTGPAGKTMSFMQMVGMIQPNVPPSTSTPLAELPDSGTLH